ncbi:AzlD domain-containing protein [Candidatus Spongiihabitans sp.]|uniref:AzlD domain-containing protein n=1 Tax=Candidatus Spongiihabitans sp. TaxID=3101308 RepID=UPI003C6F9A03
MNESRVVIGIVILFGISFIVRVLPAFVSFDFSDKTQNNIKTILPIAVFVNLMIYCINQEITHDLYPAIISIAALVLIFKPLGLLWSIVIGTVLYVSL